MLVVTTKTMQNIHCYSYEKLFPSLDLYFNNIFKYELKNIPIVLNINAIFDMIKKHNINTIWFFRSYYNPAFYEEGNLITDIDMIKLMKMNLNIFFSCSDLDNVSRGGDNLVNFLNKMCKYKKFYILDTYLYKNLAKKNIKISEDHYFRVKHFAYHEFCDIEFNNNPINKVILSGAINKSYPSRETYKKFGDKNEDKVFIAKRNDETTEKKYYHILNEYIAGFAGVAIGTGFFLAKFVEIPASGTLLLAYVDDMEELTSMGFYNNVNCLVVKDNNFEEITNYILDKNNKGTINEIRKKGRENVVNNHTLTHRLNQFEEIFNKLSIGVTRK